MKTRTALLLFPVLPVLLAAKHPEPGGPGKSIRLPGAGADGAVSMDYLAYDHLRHRLWVPAGNTGRVDVVGSDGSVHEAGGFPTKEVTRGEAKRVVGPSSATVGDRAVYVGNRGDSSVCAVDAITLQKGACATLDSMPDGLAWVAATKEVWVTTPRDRSLRVLDGRSLASKGTIALPGEPEGFAVDDGRSTFFTNLEDKDKTLSIDLEGHTIRATWEPHCGEEGPKGLALDLAADVLFVACPDHVIALDVAHDGKLLSQAVIGSGIDNLDYLESRKELYVAAGKAGLLEVLVFDPKAKMLRKVWRAVTAPGARNAVAADDGTAYVTDSREGKILVVPVPSP